VGFFSVVLQYERREHRNMTGRVSRIEVEISRMSSGICNFMVRLMDNQSTRRLYRGGDKSLARPGRKQATATEDFDFYTSYL
jgi:hypothetical protein